MKDLRAAMLMLGLGALLGFTGCAPEPEVPPPAPAGNDELEGPGLRPESALEQGGADAGLPPEDQPAQP
ncbi:hypothetical protein [Candidatus Laterigemmans baculatus]|uniref:hypothetical protein n=1 Tax=Candidatus Laterigemmans baculatus TaxID=2770505 RepID=UPI0013DA6A78|nr:hypothetical protein [Candidatus Laterigemmans baculatus]